MFTNTEFLSLILVPLLIVAAIIAALVGICIALYKKPIIAAPAIIGGFILLYFGLVILNKCLINSRIQELENELITQNTLYERYSKELKNLYVEAGKIKYLSNAILKNLEDAFAINLNILAIELTSKLPSIIHEPLLEAKLGDSKEDKVQNDVKGIEEECDKLRDNLDQMKSKPIAFS